jgi:hypothetical protein
VLVQEGEKPPEDPEELLKELESVADQLAALIAQINKTNLSTTLPDGRTLTDALARRDYLALLQAAFHQVAETASANQTRYGKAEIRILRLARYASREHDARPPKKHVDDGHRALSATTRRSHAPSSTGIPRAASPGTGSWTTSRCTG